MKWSFPSNNYGQVNGIADSGIETFQGTPLKSLSREICQNSLDASIGETATVEFSCFQLDAESLPGINDLQQACTSAHAHWKSNNSDRATRFFTKALSVLNKPQIPVLRISDYNTTGLRGSKEEYNSPWSNLIKSSGASDKGGSSGGSFGIGKWAPFACSQLHTVFYSTLDVDQEVASQGVARLASFKNDDGETTQGIGYYGEEHNTPYFDVMDLQPGYSRKACGTGTDIYIAGFAFADDEWKDEIIVSALEGFLYAFLNDKLIVKVNDFVLKKETLPQAMEIYKAFYEKTNRASEHADEYYEVLTCDATQQFSNENYRNMGRLELSLLIKEGYHNKVAMIRKMGMKIFEQGGNPHAVPFAGVLYVNGEAIDSFLRKLENPAHTAWEDARYTEDPSYARKIKSEIHKFIKDSVRSLQVDMDTDSVDADVGEYLPDDAEAEGTHDEAKVEVLSDMAKEVEKKVSAPKSSKNSNTEEAQGEDGTFETGGDTETTGGFVHGGGHHHEDPPDPSPEKDGEQPAKGKRVMPIPAAKSRIFCLNKATGEYTLIFEPKTSACNAEIEVFQSAESGSYPVDITSVLIPGQKDTAFEGNQIKGLTFEKGKALRIRFSIDYNDYCSMEVNGYGTQN